MVRHPRLPTALSSLILGAVFLWSALAAGSASAVDLAGAWSGSWASTSTGHAGPLRATFTPCGPGRYSVEFRGRFCRLLPFRYTVVLTVVEDGGDSVTLAGTSFLGRLFGTFTYRATADDCRFEACYTSRRDQGSFRLSRSGG